jgi:hypothetical protein
LVYMKNSDVDTRWAVICKGGCEPHINYRDKSSYKKNFQRRERNTPYQRS